MVSLLCFLATALRPEVRLYVLDGGGGVIRDTSLMSDEEEGGTKPVRLADPCFLIRHGGEWMVWDTGLPDSLVGHPVESPSFKLTKAATMTSQLATLHLKPADVKYVAFSHLHFDHTGTANLFAGSTWILERRELNYALQKPSPFSVSPETFSGYAKAKRRMIDGDCDVFGDGTVKILLTPGHTPGHCCLLLRLPKSGAVVLSGDLFHSRVNYEHSRVPAINESRAETLASIARIHGILKNLHARLVIQHDPGDFQQLKREGGLR